jgi:hypothetical protein
MTREERRSLQLHEAIAERLVEHPGEVMVRVRRTLERMSAGPAGTSPPLREWRREIGIRAAARRGRVTGQALRHGDRCVPP